MIFMARTYTACFPWQSISSPWTLTNACGRATHSCPMISPAGMVSGTAPERSDTFSPLPRNIAATTTRRPTPSTTAMWSSCCFSSEKKDGFAAFRNADLRDFPLFKQAILQFRAFYKQEEFSLKQIDQYLWQLVKEKFPKYPKP